MAWFKTGQDAQDEMDREEERRAAQQDRIFRHWMKEGTERHLTFCDDKRHPVGEYDFPFVYEEHNIYLNGSWKNWFTCIEGLPHPDTGKPQTCPICALGTKESRPYLACAATVIDHARWESKKNPGQIHQHEIKLFIAKAQIQKVLRKNSKKRDGLRGWHVEVSRSTKQAASTGDQFDFERRLTDEDFEKVTDGKFKALPQPLNYHELLAPKTQEEIEGSLAGGNSGGSGYDAGANSYDGESDVKDEFIKF